MDDKSKWFTVSIDSMQAIGKGEQNSAKIY